MTCRLRIYAEKKNIRQHRKQDSCEMLRFRPDATTPNTRASVWKLLKSDQQHTQTCCSMLHSTLIAICANNKKKALSYHRPSRHLTGPLDCRTECQRPFFKHTYEDRMLKKKKKKREQEREGERQQKNNKTATKHSIRISRSNDRFSYV